MASEIKDQHIPRKGEAKLVTTRSNRIVQDGEFWYFHTREDVRIGPFNSHELAMKGSMDYVGFVVDADPDVLGSLSQ